MPQQKDAIVMNGGGTYGYSPGQPALLSDSVGTNAVTGDLMIVNASCCYWYYYSRM